MSDRLIRWLWARLPLADREAFVARSIENRARRRAALGPFSRSFEDEINAAAIDMIRDVNRQMF